MKPLFSSLEWKQIDQETVRCLGFTPWDLMEEASVALCQAMLPFLPKDQPIHVVIGSGNNGGDGLAVARLLQNQGWRVNVWFVPTHPRPSAAWEKNRQLWTGPWQEVTPIDLDTFQEKIKKECVVEALLGLGTSRAVTGFLAQVIATLNESGTFRIALDMPAGLRADVPTLPLDGVLRADVTVTCHQPKLSLLLPDYEEWVGQCIVAPIMSFEKVSLPPSTQRMYWLDTVSHLIPTRSKFGHKGSFGHVLVLAGSAQMPGAAFLTTKACLRMGAGKVTCATESSVSQLVPLMVPEAMARPIDTLDWSQISSSFQAIAVGPGWTTAPDRFGWLQQVLRLPIPLVLDADALNVIAEHRDLIAQLPPETILTPHPKEFERLLGHGWKSDFDKLTFLRQFAVTYGVIVCLKGAHTCIALPNGDLVFNQTGNPGMATAGSGDVLTGMIASWLAQGVSPTKAAFLGVFLHGEAGDRAAANRSERALMASDIIEAIR